MASRETNRKNMEMNEIAKEKKMETDALNLVEFATTRKISSNQKYNDG